MEYEFLKDRQYYKFCAYGFLKNLRFFEPFMMLFFVDKGLQYAQVGLLYAIRELLRNILEVPAGIVADAMGRRKVMIVSFVLYIVSFLVFSLVVNYFSFIVGMVFYSLGDAFRTGTHKAMILDYLKMNGWQKQKVAYYGHTRSWSQKGSAISSLVAGLIIFLTKSYSLIFAYAAIPYVLNLILIGSYPKELDGMSKRFDSKEIGKRYRSVLRQFYQSFTKLNVLAAISTTAIFTAYYKSVKDYLQPVLRSVALSVPIVLNWESEQRTAVVIGLVFFIIYLLTSFASKNAGRVADKFPNLRIGLLVTLGVGLFSGFLSGVFYHYSLAVLAIVFYVLIYLVENLRKPIGVGYISDQMEGDILATALSAESQLASLFASIVAIGLGFLSDLYGVGIALMSVSLILFLPAMIGFKVRQKF